MAGPARRPQLRFAVDATGGHAAQPHRTVDPVVAASAIVLGLQSIVARNADPLAAAVVSVTSFRTASDTFNVIPEEVELLGAVRLREVEKAQQEVVGIARKLEEEGLLQTGAAAGEPYVT